MARRTSDAIRRWQQQAVDGACHELVGAGLARNLDASTALYAVPDSELTDAQRDLGRRLEQGNGITSKVLRELRLCLATAASDREFDKRNRVAQLERTGTVEIDHDARTFAYVPLAEQPVGATAIVADILGMAQERVCGIRASQLVGEFAEVEIEHGQLPNLDEPVNLRAQRGRTFRSTQTPRELLARAADLDASGRPIETFGTVEMTGGG